MGKEFDEKTSDQFREIHAYIHEMRLGTNEIFQALKDKPDADEIYSNIPPWSYLYDHSFKIFLALLILEFDIAAAINKIVQSQDKLQGLLDFLGDADDLISRWVELPMDESYARFSFVIALINQFSSLSVHGISISDLVQKAREGNDEALFDAVMIDKTVTSTPSIAHRIHMAELSGNEVFMDKLTKAMRSTKPKRRRPAEEYDELRSLLVLFDEQISFDNIKHKDLLKLVEEDLKIYPKGNDTVDLRAFEQFIDRLKNKYRT